MHVHDTTLRIHKKGEYMDKKEINRKEICRKASLERWHPTIPKATHEGKINIGGQIIECDVLKDGRRILRHRAFSNAMGKSKASHEMREGSIRLKIPVFVCANNLRPYLGKEILEGGAQIFYKSKNGRKLIGYDATMLPETCKVYVKADDDNSLLEQQKPIAAICRAMLYSLASVGIIALVDEATGFQEERAKNELQELLKVYISQELMPWTKKFPAEFFKQVYKLHGWNYPKIGKNHPQYVAKFINKYVYRRLPIGILERLNEINPPNDNGNRKHRHHQNLSEQGLDNLNKQIVQTITLMKISKDLNQFDKFMDEVQED